MEGKGREGRKEGRKEGGSEGGMDGREGEKFQQRARLIGEERAWGQEVGGRPLLTIERRGGGKEEGHGGELMAIPPQSRNFKGRVE